MSCYLISLFLFLNLNYLCYVEDIHQDDCQDFPGGAVDKTLPANAGDVGLISCPGRFHVLLSS